MMMMMMMNMTVTSQLDMCTHAHTREWMIRHQNMTPEANAEKRGFTPHVRRSLKPFSKCRTNFTYLQSDTTDKWSEMGHTEFTSTEKVNFLLNASCPETNAATISHQIMDRRQLQRLLNRNIKRRKIVVSTVTDTYEVECLRQQLQRVQHCLEHTTAPQQRRKANKHTVTAMHKQLHTPTRGVARNLIWVGINGSRRQNNHIKNLR